MEPIYVTDKYDPKVGFVARTNSIVTDPGFFLQQRDNWLPPFIRQYSVGGAYTLYHNTTTLKLTDRYININPLWVQFQDGGVISWNLIITKQNLDSTFNPLGVNIKRGVYNYIRHKISISTDQSGKFSVSVIADLGQYYNGSYNILTTNLSFAPLPYFFVSPDISFGELKDIDAGMKTKEVTLYSIIGRVALNPRVQLSAIFQKLSVANSISWNTRFSWEFKPLSYFYIVFNTNNDVYQSVTTVNKQFITKISFLQQF